MPCDVSTTPLKPVENDLQGMPPAAIPGPLKPLLRGVLHEHSAVAALAAGTMLVLAAQTPEVLEPKLGVLPARADTLVLCQALCCRCQLVLGGLLRGTALPDSQ